MINRVVLLTLVSFLISALAQADNNTVTTTKTKIKQLDTQITSLRKILATANDKRGILNKELAATDKQIGESVHQLRSLQNDINSKQEKIVTLQKQVDELNQQLVTQQKLLANHVKTRYRMGEYQPLKWLLNQDDPHAISRLLTFYQYLVQSRQTIIDNIDTTRSNLTRSQDDLKRELTEQQVLKQQLNSNQKQLENNKRYNTAVIRTLNQDIQSKQIKLTEFEKDKTNLSRLLNTLAHQSIAVPKHPFTHMRHKLPRPVQVGHSSVQRMNQGVTFFAGEGTPVTAVYPGRVVFSDWLKGYGLLLIIDHGQGFMTLYAHNQSLFKRKGNSVMQGETIAAVGHSGGIKQNGLYFEVRQRGKAVSPLDWLA